MVWNIKKLTQIYPSITYQIYFYLQMLCIMRKFVTFQNVVNHTYLFWERKCEEKNYVFSEERRGGYSVGKSMKNIFSNPCLTLFPKMATYTTNWYGTSDRVWLRVQEGDVFIMFHINLSLHPLCTHMCVKNIFWLKLYFSFSNLLNGGGKPA